MKLYEFEGKMLFSRYGIPTPHGTTLQEGEPLPSTIALPAAVKAQVLRGKRMKNHGIAFVESEQELDAALPTLLGATVNAETVSRVLIEEKLAIEREFYLAITWHAGLKRPVVICSQTGGIDIEELKKERPEDVVVYPFTVRGGLSPWEARAALRRAGFSGTLLLRVAAIACALWECFQGEDARLVEINPLVKTVGGDLVAADAKIILDDDALIRHSERTFAKRSPLGRAPTEREQRAEAIDSGEDYYRGTASKYIELDGDIAVLFSGGGASVAASDALIAEGGRLANYTEYSGNPPQDKVYKLTKVVLSKPGIKGLWICGGTANFTRIDTTMAGIVQALREIRPTIPIVVRRAGPYETEGLQMLRDVASELSLDIEVHGSDTPMTATAATIIHKAYGHSR